eukprot:10858301-Heterocapsa_arctica.AAC.1
MYANNDAFFFGLGLRWRADPGAHAILAPWQVMQAALNNQVFNTAGLDWLWEVSIKWRTGPLACAVTALARTSIKGSWQYWIGALGSL